MLSGRFGSSHSKPPQRPTPLTHRPRILLVEDHADTRLMYSEFLGTDYEVSEADDGLAAVALLEEQVPDVVVTDLSLPRMDGFELIRRIRAGERTASLPVIALSGYSGPEHIERAHAVGTTLVLQKPCSPDGLLLAIARLLQREAAGESP